VGTSIENLEKLFGKFLQNGKKESGIPALWDGKASERIIEILLTKL
jgi:UDP-N-acetylglucosamine 2-epimerase (non-hydrolysing)